MNTDKEIAQEILNMLSRRHTILLGEYDALIDSAVEANDKKLNCDLRMIKSGRIDEVDFLRTELKKALIEQGVL